MKLFGSIIIFVMCSITAWADVSGVLLNPDRYPWSVFNIEVTNAEAEELFNAILVESVQTPQGSWARGYTVQDDRQRLFNVYCEVFKRTGGFYSCTIELFRSRRSTLKASSAKLVIPDYNPRYFAPDSAGKIFNSLDGKLSILSEQNNAGVKSFVIHYKEKP